MLDHLRIQCPSCGIILDVKNSRHEAIKQIVCPNCKKQLAVNFEEELEPAAPPQPIEPLYYGEMRIDLNEGVNKISLPNCDKAEIKVVRLKDGNSKCLVRPLGEIPVIVNRQQLLADEQVALSKGDYLEIGKTVLRAGEPGTINPEPPTPPTQIAPKPKKPKKDRSYVWLYTAIAFVMMMGATIILWEKEPIKPKPIEEIAQEADSVDNIETTEEKVASETGNKVICGGSKDSGNSGNERIEQKKVNYKEKSDYELEQLANKGDVEAQYEFGRRKIGHNDSVSVVIGIKYLKEASNNGSSKAQIKLNDVFRRLMNESARGNSTANNILKENQ